MNATQTKKRTQQQDHDVEPRKEAVVETRKAVPTKDRHVQRYADKRNCFPKPAKRTTRPFETTLDF